MFIATTSASSSGRGRAASLTGSPLRLCVLNSTAIRSAEHLISRSATAITSGVLR